MTRISDFFITKVLGFYFLGVTMLIVYACGMYCRDHTPDREDAERLAALPAVVVTQEYVTYTYGSSPSEKWAMCRLFVPGFGEVAVDTNHPDFREFVEAAKNGVPIKFRLIGNGAEFDNVKGPLRFLYPEGVRPPTPPPTVFSIAAPSRDGDLFIKDPAVTAGSYYTFTISTSVNGWRCPFFFL